jgi:hypothetical protein
MKYQAVRQHSVYKPRPSYSYVSRVGWMLPRSDYRAMADHELSNEQAGLMSELRELNAQLNRILNDRPSRPEARRVKSISDDREVELGSLKAGEKLCQVLRKEYFSLKRRKENLAD